MTGRKGELSPAAVDRGWPYQVALLADLCGYTNFYIHEEFCKGSSRCKRGHPVFYEDKHYLVHCFSSRGDAQAFMQEFGGEWFDPRRGRVPTGTSGIKAGLHPESESA
ncbi:MULTISPECIES: hypothetical protein [unclassified Rhizobium]|uniref:hypothetical protein n=1 Tax=unclassified Rhizobium TaxID=2613769 RepID=UPI0017CB5087|nr:MULTISPECIES: hypothetical protein [unclassified Rhizobium]MBB3290503.1 hypothetical protein [Rhizobium sp. BK252]MBB3405179.1 hypothetical protein [Rhizobium sp. BK289]MBB3417830.1 hypothetical protein [Rhizobium sp. BK284]MBB3485709.1 hypothetical protein [Rhizobium sp. BK347]